MREWAKLTFDWNKVAELWNQVLTASSIARPPASSTSPTADPLFQEAFACHQAGKLPEAEAMYRRILEAAPDNFDALHLLGVIAHQVGKNEQAVELISRAIQLNPNSAEAHSNRGSALHALQRYEAARADLDRAVLLKPDFADAYGNRGNVLLKLQLYKAAVESFDQAIRLRPDLASAWNDRGLALHKLRDYQAAVESFDQALHLKPDFAEAYNNRGTVFHDLDQYRTAIESYEQAIRCKPGFADAYANRGTAQQELQQYPAAVESFTQAIRLGSGAKYLHGLRLHMKRAICDWEDSKRDLRDIEARVNRGEEAAHTFALLAAVDSPALHRKAAEIEARDKCAPRAGSAPIARRPRGEKIRIGYFSADFYNHATSYLMAELFEQHDRARFEVLGFSFGPDVNDGMRGRVSAAMDRFVDVRALTDRAVAQLSRELELDIAVDLKGFTRNSRPGIFAERAAPIQVSYLGYPGTMGACCMDYLIADHALIPEADQRHYSEKIAYLPNSYQVNDSRRPISANPCTRGDEGLPGSGFVYCCFNNNFKIAPDTFDIWMRVLRRVEGSVLWLLEDNPAASANLRREAESRGVSPERLIFARRLPLAEHLSRHRLADLFLDTLPYNAHTSASDALWAGLPVLTCMGNAFAGRVAASLLRAIDLPQLIATAPAAYETLAVDLALNSQRLREIREKLQRNRLSTPLFDTAAFTRDLEAAFTAMYERYQADLPPKPIHISKAAESGRQAQTTS